MVYEAFLVLVTQINESEVMYEKWFIANQKCKQHLIVSFKGIILISWSIYTVPKRHHYSSSLSVTEEGSSYVAKHKKNLIESSKRGTSSPVYQNFSMINSLIIIVEKLIFKLLTAVRDKYMVWGQDKTKSKWLKNQFQHITVRLQGKLLLFLVKNFWENLKTILSKVIRSIFNYPVLTTLQTEKSVVINPKFLDNKEFLFKKQNCLLFQTLKKNSLSKINGRFYCVSASSSNVAHYKKDYENLFSKENINLIEKYVKSEQKLLAEWAVNNICFKKIRRKQNVLFRSRSFRIYSVYKISKSKGRYSSGIDGEKFSLDKSYMFAMVERLQNLKNYKCRPVKRILIPKRSGGQRPLGIPTIFDRCVQQLLVLILEPVIEPFSDSNSYGFRSFKSAHNALGQLKQSLESRPHQFEKWIFSADIVSFFDEVSNEWLTNNIPLNGISLRVLKSILNAGCFFERKFVEQLKGTPQGGIISPLLANFVLNGLQDVVVNKSIEHITKSVSKNYTIRHADGKKTSINLKPNFCRYADDIVVICRSKNIAQLIKKQVILFLQERGLKLSETKSYIKPIKQCKLKYLGYIFQYQENVFIKSKKINLYPSPESLLEVKNKLRTIFINSQNLTAYELISKLNPVIKGWCSYFSLSQSYKTLKKLEQFLYKRCWVWALKKHRRWGKKKIASVYFKNSTRFKGRIWNFKGFTKNKSRFKEDINGKVLYLQLPTVCCKVVPAKHFHLKENLRSIHAFSPEIVTLEKKLLAMKIGKMPKYDLLNYKERLFIKQKGSCGLCYKQIGDNEETYLHHIQPISKKGSKYDINNIILVHSFCHSK